MKKNTPALTMIKELVSIAHIADDLHVSKRAISDLKQAETGLPDNQKSGNRDKEEDHRWN